MTGYVEMINFSGFSQFIKQENGGALIRNSVFLPNTEKHTSIKISYTIKVKQNLYIVTILQSDLIVAFKYL